MVGKGLGKAFRSHALDLLWPKGKIRDCSRPIFTPDLFWIEGDKWRILEHIHPGTKTFFCMRNSKLSWTPLWFCAQLHGRVADDVITSHETATAWYVVKCCEQALQGSLVVGRKRSIPPSAPYHRESLLARRLPYKLRLVIYLMYIHANFFGELLLTVISWHDANVNIQHRLSSLIRGNVPDLKNSRCFVVLSFIAKAAGR